MWKIQYEVNESIGKIVVYDLCSHETMDDDLLDAEQENRNSGLICRLDAYRWTWTAFESYFFNFGALGLRVYRSGRWWCEFVLSAPWRQQSHHARSHVTNRFWFRLAKSSQARTVKQPPPTPSFSRPLSRLLPSSVSK